MVENEKSNESLTGEKKGIKNGLQGLQSRTICYNVNIKKGMIVLDNKNLIKKIDELLGVLYEDKKEAKATELETPLLMLEGELKEFKENIDFLLYKRQIIDICKYEFESKIKDSILNFNDFGCQKIIDLIIGYAEDKKLDGIKLSNGTIISMFNFGLRLCLYGYSINDIDFLLGVMLGALLNG